MKTLMLSLLLLGCASAPLQRENDPTVFVSYQGVGAIQVWVSVDGGFPRRLGMVQPGLPECFRLPNTYGTMSLWVSEVGSKDVLKSPTFDNSYRYWVWSLSASLTTTRINLVPTDHSCFSKKTEART